ncbi:MAG: transcriptional coactivator/pterin dehydratase [Frankiales bacterium]|jgi:4a-hydroxytetrahydrobiopterin dehydratase|nr:transcriptional coactivator/pterin dehydratase [Frankiales bacterium]
MSLLPLTAAELAAALAALPAWAVEDGKLTTRRTLPSFPAAIGFVQQVAQVAEELDHHPDIDIRWRTVTLAVSTHAAGGALTRFDVKLAARIDEL